MICQNCGREIEDDTYVCKYCGVATTVDYSNEIEQAKNDTAGCCTIIFSFLFPIIGLILYFAWKDCKPKSAGTAAKCAGAGIILHIISVLIDKI
ncbi:MAG: zinc ribbon domain-containing protein [Clostridium sp.]